MNPINKIKLFFQRKKQKDFYAKIGEKAFSREAISTEDASGGQGILVTLSKRLGLRNGDITSKDFEDPEYDLTEIDLAYETDSYVRQGLDKYLEQCFKEGYEFYGSNVAAVEYIELRLLFIAKASGIPTEQLISNMTEDVVKYANSIVLKARKQDETQIPPTTNVVGIDGKEPVVAYFPAHPATFKIKRDKNGTVQGYQQEVDGGDKALKFKTEDVIHIPYKKKRGNAFGTPFILSVLNDVKALRFLEENVVNMVYKHVNPLIHARVGDSESPGTKQEIDDVEANLNGMDPSGGFVSTNRVELVAVSTNNAIDARPSLDYLEARVFTGLGVPGIAMGRGGTANRNTADAMTAEMSDRIKAIQRTVENHFNNEIIMELLQEGGFDPLTNPQDMVYLKFKENDLDKKIKYENHCTFLFEHNVITEEELRDAIDKDPITDRAGLYYELYTVPTMQAKQSQTASNAGTKAGNNKNKPENQQGEKQSSKKTANYLIKMILKDDELTEKDKEILKNYINSINLKYPPALLNKRVINMIKKIKENYNEHNSNN